MIRIIQGENPLRESKLKQLRRRLEKIGKRVKSVEILTGYQKGIWSVFEDTVVISWVAPAGDRSAREKVTQDIAALTGSLAALLPKYFSDGLTPRPGCFMKAESSAATGRAPAGASFLPRRRFAGIESRRKREESKRDPRRNNIHGATKRADLLQRTCGHRSGRSAEECRD